MSVDAPAWPDEQIPEDTPVHGLAFGAAAAALEPAGEDPIRVRMTGGDILKVTLPANQMIQEQQARAAGAAARSLAHGRRLPVLMIITGVLGVSIEARQVYANLIPPSRFALVGESPVDRVIAHYLLRWTHESTPARFFTSKVEAVGWLRQYVHED